MANGKVKWFDDKKGFGFIAGSDGKDVFVHYKNISSSGHKTLAEDQEVTYELEASPKGPIAKNVTPT